MTIGNVNDRGHRTRGPAIELLEAQTMKYVLLTYQPKNYEARDLSESEYKTVAAEYAALADTPNVKSGFPLGFPKDAVTVRMQDNETVTSPGTFVDHPVGAYVEFDAATREEAVRLAARIPAVRLGGAVEIRPAKPYW